VSRARFESKVMQASTAYRMTAYRMTVYRHHPIRLDRTSSQLPLGKTESAPGSCSVKFLKIEHFSVPERVRGELWKAR